MSGLNTMASEQEQLRERIFHFRLSHSKPDTVAHFTAENVARSTIYSILANAEQRGTVSRKRGSGRSPTIMTKRRVTALIKKVDNHADVSSKKIAAEMGCSDGYVRQTLLKNGIRCYRKRRSPAYTDEQVPVVKRCCRWMYNEYREHFFVLDDEKYFSLSSPYTGSYRSSDRVNAPANIKYQPKKKFEPKLLVYLAASSKGISKPFYAPSGIAVNQDVYLRDCLEGILLPFLRQHHSEDQYVFWPDKASSHYSRAVVEFLTEKEINFVPKERNPTNLPQCRPIEDIWGTLTDLVYEGGWRAKTMQQLKYRITQCIKKLDPLAVKRAFDGIRASLGRVYREGPMHEAH